MSPPGQSTRTFERKVRAWVLLVGSTCAVDANASEHDSAPLFSRAPSQWAVAGTLDLGLSARSVASLGYGQPHWWWLGVDLRSTLSSTFAAQGVGLRWVLPLGEVGVQAKRMAPYEPRSPVHSRSYDSDHLTSDDGNLEYDLLEAWLTAYAPLFGGVGYTCIWIDRVSGVAPGHALYEEVTRAVVAPPWAGSEQLAYLLPLTRGHYAGPFMEHVWSSRQNGSVWRAGGGYYASFGPHTSLLAYVTVPFVTRDQLAFADGAGGSMTLSYAWSSTDPQPGWP